MKFQRRKTMSRNFDNWLATMKDSVATWTYYTDFAKALPKDAAKYFR